MFDIVACPSLAVDDIFPESDRKEKWLDCVLSELIRSAVDTLAEISCCIGKFHIRRLCVMPVAWLILLGTGPCCVNRCQPNDQWLTFWSR